MWIIYITLIAMLVMARKPKRRRRMGRYIRGNLAIDTQLSTLGAKTAVLGSSDTVIDRTLVSSIVATYSISNLTAAAGDGPIQVGVAHSDYTLAQIEEYLELATSWNETDLIDKEVQSRKIRRIGVFDTSNANPAGSYTLNNGRAIKTKLNWIMTNGQGITFFFYNLGTSALATTDPNVNVNGHANLWPR